jgi:mannan endo-1,4-beta-mannosidase
MKKRPALLLTVVLGSTLLTSKASWGDVTPPCTTCDPAVSLTKEVGSIINPSAPVDSQLTPETLDLLKSLRTPQRTGILFGHQNSTFYGLDENTKPWKNDGTQNTDRSDVKTATGNHAALLGADIADALHHEVNPKIPSNADEIRRNFQAAARRGQVVTVSWHAHDPINPDWDYDDFANHQKDPALWDKLDKSKNDRRSRCEAILKDPKVNANFMKSLESMAGLFKSIKDDEGKAIPILFRPFHEQTGGWFWWGKGHCSEKDFADIWKLTVKTLRDKHEVHQLIYVYSPNQMNDTPGTYYQGYPGDEYVDVLALDAYHDLDTQAGSVKTGQDLAWMVREARKKGKIAALSETGLESFRTGKWGGGSSGTPNQKWFSQNLGLALANDPDAKDLAYIMVWRNGSESHHYFPGPWERDVIEDFNAFRKKYGVQLLHEWNENRLNCEER